MLARRAGSVRKADSLASWLHGVALRVARRARAGAVRRKAYERRGAAIRAAELESRSSPDAWPELQEEIARLPERYREPVVLYYLEGLTTEEAAMRIGCAHGTVLSRLSRARDRLRRRLERRGLGWSASVLAAAARPRPAALPTGWLDTTVRAASGFAVGSASGAAPASVAAAALAQGALQMMTFSKFKFLGAAALACGLAWEGVQALGQFGEPVAGGEPADSRPDAEDRQAALTRSVDKLQSDLEESVRRHAEMRKAVRDIRAELKSLLDGGEPSVVRGAAIRLAEEIRADTIQAVNRLADALKRHPARLSRDRGFGYQTYMMDLVSGGMTLIVDEPLPDQNCSGTPRWSHDGRRIVFDTTGNNWPVGRLMSIEEQDGRPVFAELGPGDAPSFSPDDRRIAFLLHPGAQAGAEPGIWVMHADGSGRRRVGEFGAPFWSPDGREFLINSSSDPTEAIVINLETKQGGVVKVRGHELFSWPSWVAPGTLVSALTTDGQADRIAILDVRRPEEAKVIEVLWRRDEDIDVTPRWAVRRPGTDQYFFVGVEPTHRTLYTLHRGASPGRRR